MGLGSLFLQKFGSSLVRGFFNPLRYRATQKPLRNSSDRDAQLFSEATDGTLVSLQNFMDLLPAELRRVAGCFRLSKVHAKRLWTKFPRFARWYSKVTWQLIEISHKNGRKNFFD